MNRDRLIGVINECLTKQLHVTEINIESELVADYCADDLDIVELTMRLEEALHININDDELAKVKTVKQLYDYIEKVNSDDNISGRS